MNILNNLTIKHLLLNKKRTIVTIIGIILSTALMVGIGLLFATFQDYSKKEIISYQGSYQALLEQLPKEKLSRLDSAENLDYFYEQTIGFSLIDEESIYRPYLHLNSANQTYFEEITLKEGRYPENSNEIIVPTNLPTNYRLFDTITISYGPRYDDEGDINYQNSEYIEGETLQVETTKTYTIVGIIDNNPYENYSGAGYTIYTTIDENNPNPTYNVYLKYNPPKNIINNTKNLASKLNYDQDLIKYNTSLLAIYGESQYSNVTSTISGLLAIMLSIISIGCIIVIYNSFAISVMERKKQFGLLSSIGATKKQIFKTVFYEATIVGIIGIILGIIASYIGIGTVIIIMNNLLQGVLEFKLSLVTNPTYLIIPLIFMVVVIYISAFLPARRASRVSPIEAIRQNDDIKIEKKKIKISKLSQKIFGIEGEIALKNIKRNKKKYRITIISLFISIVMFISFSSFLDYSLNTTDNMLTSYDYDIMVSSYTADEPNPEVENLINKITRNKDVIKYSTFQTTQLDIEIQDNLYTDAYNNLISSQYSKEDIIGDDNYDSITIVGLDNQSFDEYTKELGVKNNKIILYNKYKTTTYTDENRKVNIVDVVKDNPNITICHNGTCDRTLNNIYITDEIYYAISHIEEYTGIKLIVNEDTYNYLKENYTNIDVTYKEIVIQADNFTNLDKLGEELNTYQTATYLNINTEMQMTNNIILVIKILVYGFICLVTLIGVTSVFNTINTSMNLRKKEFAILRSVGLTKKGFNKILCYESIFFGLKSLLYSLPVSFLIILLIHNNMNYLATSNLIIPWSSIIISIIGVFIITLMTMLYSSNKIKKDSILEQIREENI